MVFRAEDHINIIFMDKLRQQLIEYADGFLTGNRDEDLMILLKRDHCLQVAEIALELMKSVSSDPHKQRLAEIAGLLHDIGRFIQYRKYRTFADARSENHSVLGVRVIEERRLLADLAADERKLIQDSILMHNRAAIPDGLPERGRFYAALLRDADKIDIYRVVLEYYENPSLAGTVTLDLPDTPEVSPPVVEALREQRPVRMTDLRTVSDFKLCQLAWIYDLNLPRSYRFFRDRAYPERMCACLPEFPEKDFLIAQLTDFLASRL